MKISGIYAIINCETKNCYIGSSVDVDRRFKEHKKLLRGNRHFSPFLQRSWNKNDESIFVFSVLELCLPHNLIKVEQYYLDVLNPKYNTCRIAGNTLGRKHTERTRKIISEKQKEIAKRPETKARRSKAQKGKVRSEEHKVKISNSLKGKKNPFYGRTHTEEFKQRISERNKTQFLGENNPFYGKSHSDETKRKISETKKRQHQEKLNKK